MPISGEDKLEESRVFLKGKKMYPSVMRRIFPILVLSLIPLSGCSESGKSVELSESSTPVISLTKEEKSQLKFCNLVDKAYKSYETSGMSYETRDIFGEAYDVIHELLGSYSSSRYSDYDSIMADHSFAYGPFSDINDVVAIQAWCSNTRTLLDEKSANKN